MMPCHRDLDARADLQAADRALVKWRCPSCICPVTTPPPLVGHARAASPLRLAGGDRPYLVSGADDRLVKVWDYQTKACIQVSARPPDGRFSARDRQLAVVCGPGQPVGAYWCCWPLRASSGACTRRASHAFWLPCQPSPPFVPSPSPADARRPLAQHLHRLLPPRAAAHPDRLRGRHREAVALHHVPPGEHAQLRHGASVGGGLRQGLQLHRRWVSSVAVGSPGRGPAAADGRRLMGTW